MTHSDILIKFCVRQNRLIEALDHYHQSIEQAYANLKFHTSPRWEKAQRQVKRWQARLSKEIQKFNCLLEDSSLEILSIHPHLEKLAAQARHLSEGVLHRYRQAGEEEWGQSLRKLSQHVADLKDDLKKIDLKDALGHVKESLVVDHFDDLGQMKVIQWPRKIWHMLAALMIVSIYLFVPGTLKMKLIVFGCFTAYATICDIIRLTVPKFNALVIRDLKKFMRKREVTGLNSMTFYAISCLTVSLIFPKAIAIMAILFLGFGDPLAAIVGIKWGRHRMGRRFSLEGSFAFFGVCFFISLLYPILEPTFHGPLLIFAFLGGMVGMVSEWCSFKLDDNLVIPIVAAILLQGITLVFG